MLYSHRFARPETLDRATYWLTKFGIRAPRMRIDHQSHAISLHVGLGEIAGVASLINALELSEGNDHSDTWNAAWKQAVDEFEESTDLPTPARSPIGWHADADRQPTEAGLDDVFEAIRRSE